MIKYYIRTFYKLPPSKWILDSIKDIPEIITSIIDTKPSHRKVKDEDLEHCVSCVQIDTFILPEYRQIFFERRNWSWNDLDEMDKAWAKQSTLAKE